MTELYETRVELRLPKDLYNLLLKEAGTPRKIPTVIRERLNKSFAGFDDATFVTDHLERIDQRFERLMSVFPDLMMETLLVSGRMMTAVGKLDSDKRTSELKAMEDYVKPRLDAFGQRLKGRRD